MGRFLAVLHLRTGDSTFTVVETNQFKHLSHLSLVFRQGNDNVIKQFLAGRLAEYKVYKKQYCGSPINYLPRASHQKVHEYLLSHLGYFQSVVVTSIENLNRFILVSSVHNLAFLSVGQTINGDMHEKLRRTLHSLEKALRDVNSMSR